MSSGGGLCGFKSELCSFLLVCFYFLLICLNNETLPLDLKNSHHQVPITKDSIHNPGMKLSIFLQFWVCISVLGHSESVDAMS